MYTKNNKNFKKKKVRQPLDKNKLLAYILAGLMIFWTIASVFSFIAYGRTKSDKASNTITASAMTVEQYESGYFYIDLTRFEDLTYYTYANVLSNSTNIRQIAGHYTLRVGSQGVDLIYEYDDGEDYNYYVYPLENGVDSELLFKCFNVSTRAFVNNYGITNVTWNELPPVFDTAYPLIYTDYTFLISSTDNVSSIYTIVSVEFIPIRSDIRYYLNLSISYTLPTISSGHYGFAVPFYTDTAVGTDYLEYVDIPAVGFPIDDYTMIYTEYAEYRENHQGDYSRGYELGYSAGREYGYSLGKDVGFQEGVNSSNEYSFDGLLSAVFDVPVRTFTSLFNFEVLGVNLTTFFLSLLTLAGVLAVVRMLL